MKSISLAGGIILDSAGKLLLLHRNSPNRIQWEIPGGKIEIGEEPAAAAIRELAEELGISAQIVKNLGEQDFSEDDYVMHYTWFLVKITSGIPHITETKFDNLRYFTWENLSKIKNELSPNTKNLLENYLSGKLNIN
jgi:8-oxo-dGTP diphosphatase